MSAWAQLLLGIAALVTSLGSATAGIIIAVRGGRREQRDAVRAVVDRIAGDEYDAQIDDEQNEAINQLRQRVVEIEQGKQAEPDDE